MRKKILMVILMMFVGIFGVLFSQGALVEDASAVKEISITIPESIQMNKMKCDDIADNGITNGKVGAMQWFLCPSMDNMMYTATTLDRAVQKLLEIKTDVYTGSNVENAWGNIRNIANVLMIVFLLVIIFSQLTGYGIDNYGIKKMLPRLIVMAIIVNLSLYICQIAVDLSNIAGIGLRDLFGSFGGGAEGGSAIVGGVGAFFTALGSAGTATIGVVTTASALGLSVGAAVAGIIVVILLVLIITIAILVLLAMVGARKIIVLFCVLISPLAFAAFILPNTQNLFKKWWQAFKTALIIFPICGAVAGISVMLRGVIAGVKVGPAMAIVVTLLPYLVFFLIPMLLKEALSAIGKLGGALMNMGASFRNTGRNLGRAASNAAQHSEWGKRNMEYAAKRRQERAAQNVVNRINGREAKGKTLSEKQKAMRLTAQQKLNAIEMEKAMADVGVPVVTEELAGLRAVSAKEAQEFKNYTDQYSVLTRSQMGDELKKSVIAYGDDRSEGNALRLRAAIATAESRGMSKEILDYVGDNIEEKDANGNVVSSRLALKLNAQNGNDAKILSQLSSSSNKVISQYGIQMSKPANVGQNMSMREFATSTGPVKMSEALENKGPAILNNMDDDTLDYINRMGDTAGAPVVSGAMLANAAANTTNQKELRQINSMFGKVNADNINFSGQQLAKFDDTTLQTIISRIRPGSELQKKFIKATDDIANSPELMGSLRPEQRKIFNAVRRGANPTDTRFSS